MKFTICSAGAIGCARTERPPTSSTTNWLLQQNPNERTRKLLTKNENPDSIEQMKTKTIGLALTFCFLGWATCLAADPQMGTWKLNEAKSKRTPGTTKFNTVTFKNTLGNIKVTGDGADANGKPIHVEWSGK